MQSLSCDTALLFAALASDRRAGACSTSSGRLQAPARRRSSLQLVVDAPSEMEEALRHLRGCALLFGGAERASRRDGPAGVPAVPALTARQLLDVDDAPALERGSTRTTRPHALRRAGRKLPELRSRGSTSAWARGRSRPQQIAAGAPRTERGRHRLAGVAAQATTGWRAGRGPSRRGWRDRRLQALSEPGVGGDPRGVPRGHRRVRRDPPLPAQDGARSGGSAPARSKPVAYFARSEYLGEGSPAAPRGAPRLRGARRAGARVDRRGDALPPGGSTRPCAGGRRHGRGRRAGAFVGDPAAGLGAALGARRRASARGRSSLGLALDASTLAPSPPRPGPARDPPPGERVAIADLISSPTRLLTRVADLPDAVRARMSCQPDDYVVTRPSVRATSTIIDEPAAGSSPSSASRSRSPRRSSGTTRSRRRPGARPGPAPIRSCTGSSTRRDLVAHDDRARRGCRPPRDQVAGCRILARLRRGKELRRTSGCAPRGQPRRPRSVIAFARPRRKWPPRFAHEAAIYARLSATMAEPSFAQLLAHGEDLGRPFLLLSWCPGLQAHAVADELRGGHDREGLLALGVAVVRAYARLHDLGVVHGDVHPGNLLVDAAGVVRLVDFGFSRVAGGDDGDRGPRRAWNGAGVEFRQARVRPRRAASRASSSFVRGGAARGRGAAVPTLHRRVHARFLARGRQDDAADRRILPVSFASCGRAPVARGRGCARARARQGPGGAIRLAGPVGRSAPTSLRPGGLPGARGRHRSPSRSPEGRRRRCSTASSGASPPAGTSTSAACPGRPSRRSTWAPRGSPTPMHRVPAVRESDAPSPLADIPLARSPRGAEQAPTDQASARTEAGECDAGESDPGEVSPYLTATGLLRCRALLPGGRPACHTSAGAAEAAGPAGSSTSPEASPAWSSAPRCSSRPTPPGHRSSIWVQARSAGSGSASTPTARSAARRSSLPAIAHGWGGLLYVTLAGAETTSAPRAAPRRSRVHELTARAEPSGRGGRCRGLGQGRRPAGADYMPGWCGGAAGLVHLFTAARRAFGDRRHLRLAEGCASASYRHPGIRVPLDRHERRALVGAGRAPQADAACSVAPAADGRAPRAGGR